MRQSWDAFLLASEQVSRTLLASGLQSSKSASNLASEQAGTDIYLYVGEDAGDGVPTAVAGVVAWCKHPGTPEGSCGPRVARKPRFISDKFKTRSES